MVTGAARIRRMVTTARRKLAWPAWLRAYGPAALLFAVLMSAASVGLFDILTGRLRALAALAALTGLFFMVLDGYRRYRPPTEDDARRLVDSISSLRPATTMIDRPVRGDPRAGALWRAHRDRVETAALAMKPPGVWRQVAAADPFYLRFAAPVALIICVILGGAGAPARMLAALRPDIGALMGADQLKAQAWANPPGYTNRAPFVIESGHTAEAPEGSEIVIRVTASGEPVLRVRSQGKTRKQGFAKGPDGAYETRLTLKDTLDAEVRLWGRRAAYALTALPDEPPVVAFVGEPETGKQDHTAFGWRVSDDFGVSRLELLVEPVEPPLGVEDQQTAWPVPLDAVEPKSAEGRADLDLTRHKWAGLRVYARLRAVDAGGQTGLSEPVEIKLPEKLFFQPLAQAAAEIRYEVLREPRQYEDSASDGMVIDAGDAPSSVEISSLERAPPGVKRAALMLDGLTWRPEGYFQDPVIYMGLRRARGILTAARDKTGADETDDLLWAVALRAEYGDSADAERALESARKALEKALRDGADEDEIKRLMQAYREAVKNYLKAQIAEALKRGAQPGGDNQSAGQAMRDNDLKRMLDALEDLAETGAHDQARQLLSDMSDLLDRMRDFQFSEGGGDGETPQDGPMADALRELGETLLNQRELNDQTRNANRGDQPSGAPGPQELARRQKELMEQLGRAEENARGETSGEAGSPDGADGQDGSGPDGDAGQGMAAEGDPGGGSSGGEPGGGAAGGSDESYVRRMAEAREAQEQAAEALARGDLDAAEEAQERALDSLAEAATEMAKRADALSRQAGLKPKGAGDRADPLGRPVGTGAPGYGDDVKVPEEMERQRARDILNELRRRAGEHGLSQDEIDYLKRLLDRF